MTSGRPPLRSEIGQSSHDCITIRGRDLTDDLLGKVDFVDLMFLVVMERLPSDDESAVLNVLLVALMEHGLTPSVLAARLTLLGAPDSVQGAMAAGLLGVGSTFVGSIEGAAKMLQTADLDAPDAELAAAIVDEFVGAGRRVPGLGHPVHKDEDPRAAKLFQIAAQHGVSGRHESLLEAVREAAESRTERHLPINATGAIGAIASDLGFPWQICRSLGVVARAAGLAGHLLEEMRNPLAREVWLRADEEVSGR
jgi:citrate synthase